MCSIAGPGDVVGDVARPERQSHIGVDGRGVPSWWERQVGAKQLVGRFLGEQRVWANTIGKLGSGRTLHWPVGDGGWADVFEATRLGSAP